MEGGDVSLISALLIASPIIIRSLSVTDCATTNLTQRVYSCKASVSHSSVDLPGGISLLQRFGAAAVAFPTLSYEAKAAMAYAAAVKFSNDRERPTEFADRALNRISDSS